MSAYELPRYDRVTLLGYVRLRHIARIVTKFGDLRDRLGVMGYIKDRGDGTSDVS